MSKETNIQWCDSTVNPTMGCDGCELWKPGVGGTCYAGILHQRYGGHNKGFSPKFEILTEYPGRMAKAAAWSDLTGINRPDKPWLNGLPRMIFVSDMSDALSRAVSFEYLKAEVIDVVTSAKGRRHVWMWLTKQPARMVEFTRWLREQGIHWPENLWAGTSVTTQPTVSRVRTLLYVGNEQTIRFVSAEPLRSPIRLPSITDDGEDMSEGERRDCGLPNTIIGDCLELHGPRRIHLVIMGGESGDSPTPCNVAWLRSLIRQCSAGGAAAFVKQLGSRIAVRNDSSLEWPRQGDEWIDVDPDYVPRYQGEEMNVRLEDGHGGDWSDWPRDLRVREFPVPGVGPGGGG